MSSSNGKNPPSIDTYSNYKLEVITQMIKDISFENTALQEGRWSHIPQAEIEVKVEVDAKKGQKQGYEVAIRLKITSTDKEDNLILFILEMDYLGLFNISNTDDETLRMVLLVECPRLLFPFVRRIVANLTSDAGFPTLNLDPIDFQVMYQGSLPKGMKLHS